MIALAARGAGAVAVALAVWYAARVEAAWRGAAQALGVEYTRRGPLSSRRALSGAVDGVRISVETTAAVDSVGREKRSVTRFEVRRWT